MLFISTLFTIQYIQYIHIYVFSYIYIYIYILIYIHYTYYTYIIYILYIHIYTYKWSYIRYIYIYIYIYIMEVLLYRVRQYVGQGYDWELKVFDKEWGCINKEFRDLANLNYMFLNAEENILAEILRSSTTVTLSR